MLNNNPTTASRAWRWRRCPQCSTVERASDFAVIGTYRAGWSYGPPMQRRCPACGHVAVTREFEVVREQRRAS